MVVVVMFDFLVAQMLRLGVVLDFGSLFVVVEVQHCLNNVVG